MIEAVSNDVANNTLNLIKKRFYLLFFGLSALVFAISTVSSVYLSEKVSSYVVNSEFQTSLARLEKTVEATEVIQQEIKSKFTDSVESKKILRQKYEEIYLNTIEYIKHLNELTDISLHRKFPTSDDISLQKMIMLQSLYFPLLEHELKKIDSAHSEYQLYLVKLSESSEEKFHDSGLATELVTNKHIVLNQVDVFRQALVKKYSKSLNL